jgi:hypothetical protein
LLNSLIALLDSVYPSFKENSLTDKSFKHKDIVPLIEKMAFLSRIPVGESVEKRKIYSLTHSGGPVRILLWSQMHGDEACATAAFFDVINFLSGRKTLLFYPLLNRVRETILSALSIRFIPMLNPDGAERGTRENALGIDLNRDAISLLSPESLILKNSVVEFNPTFAFNMHDQDYLWSVGNTKKVAALSFLAPPYDAEKSINNPRQKAINLISLLYKLFNPLVDNRITKYSDDFEPRAFGETIAKMNVSTILIESGLWKDDPNKLFLRKINFCLLITAFWVLANASVPGDSETYSSIPYNGKILKKLA